MFNTLLSQAPRAKVLTFVSSLALVLSIGVINSLYAGPGFDTPAKKNAFKPPPPNPGDVGEWGSVLYPFSNTEFVATHVTVLPDKRLLVWGGYRESDGLSRRVMIWNPDPSCTSGCLEQEVLDKDIFGDIYCSSHSYLSDGTLLIAGGTLATAPPGTLQGGLNKVALFDVYHGGNDGLWAAKPVMNEGRWYPTSISLPSGGVLVWGGYSNNGQVNKVPQVFDLQADNTTHTWRRANIRHPELSYRYYSWLNMLSSGKILTTIGDTRATLLASAGGGFRLSGDSAVPFPLHATNSALDGLLNVAHDGGTQIVYDKDKFIVIGGGPYPDDAVETINMADTTPAWTPVANMGNRRRWHNSTILPDGKVLVTGGTQGDGEFNNTCDQNAIKQAEIWTPGNPGTWTPMASASRMRIYHSAAVLLPDGRVFTGGTSEFDPDGTYSDLSGTISCPGIDNDSSVEIYSPPYLFNSDGTPVSNRPVISSGDDPVYYGQNHEYKVSNPGSEPKMNLVKLPSVTHAFNHSQGFYKLTTTLVDSTTVRITLPSNRNELVPGHYMMFLLNGNKVSVAKIIRVA